MTNNDLQIVEASQKNLGRILELNQNALPHVNSLTLEDMETLSAASSYFRACVSQDKVAGFLLAMTPDCDYQSPNFLWFRERYPSFVYIDRIVVSPDFRRLGIGSMLYQDVSQFASRTAPALTCEVNIKPANPGSMRFHQRLGFRQVGSQDTEDGKKTVALMRLDFPARPPA